MNKTSTKPLLLHFLFLLGFSMLLVECDKLFPSDDARVKHKQGTIGINNFLLDVPAKPVSHVIEATCENQINSSPSTYFTNLSLPSRYPTAYSYKLFDNAHPALLPVSFKN